MDIQRMLAEKQTGQIHLRSWCRLHSYNIFDLEEAQMLYVLHADGGHLPTTNATIKRDDYFIPPLLPKILQD